jgi:hypothetical protein
VWRRREKFSQGSVVLINLSKAVKRPQRKLLQMRTFMRLAAGSVFNSSSALNQLTKTSTQSVVKNSSYWHAQEVNKKLN